MNLGELIQQYISEHRMSYREFAALSDLSAGYISMLINNRNPKSCKPPIPTIRTYNGIAKAMNYALHAIPISKRKAARAGHTCAGCMIIRGCRCRAAYPSIRACSPGAA